MTTRAQQMRDRVFRAVEGQLAVAVPFRKTNAQIIEIVAEQMHVQPWQVRKALAHSKPRGRQRKARCAHCHGTGYAS